ncbi:hypothetical protein OAM78_03465 [Alphaproteobacteria bacterium]|nr:hypothetical protein [Alphaproteobacteria bacterium]
MAHCAASLSKAFRISKARSGFPAVSFARISDCVTSGCSASWQGAALRGGMNK